MTTARTAAPSARQGARSRDAARALFRSGVTVAGNDRSVVKPHELRRVAPAPVGVDHQPREPRPDHRAVERRGQRPRHAQGARIPRDVAGHVLGRESQRSAQIRGHGIGGVVAGDEKPALPSRAFDMDGLVGHDTFAVCRHFIEELRGKGNSTITAAALAITVREIVQR